MSENYDKLWQKVINHKYYNRCQLNREGCNDMAYNGAHHIIPRKYTHYRYDMQNGFAVCPKCHQWIEEHPLQFSYILRTEHNDQYKYIDYARRNMAKIVLDKEKVSDDIDKLKEYCREYNI